MRMKRSQPYSSRAVAKSIPPPPARDPRLQRLSRKIAKAKQAVETAQAALEFKRGTQTNVREIVRFTVAQLNYARSE